ncbi:MAG: type II toxin-antitoxin system VapC family toxin [Cytophagaceae bacterium]|nr:type II toxin-antitoxin system VapC family toxin [Cytophagaceae bacterium]
MIQPTETSLILLDTITFDLLATEGPKKLTATARQEIEQATTVYSSTVSLWELANHVQEGVIVLSVSFEEHYRALLRAMTTELLPLEWKALAYLSTFDLQIIEKPWRVTKRGQISRGIKRELHRDPFDRMIIAHAISMQIPLGSPDSLFPHYKPKGLKLIW